MSEMLYEKSIEKVLFEKDFLVMLKSKAARFDFFRCY